MPAWQDGHQVATNHSRLLCPRSEAIVMVLPETVVKLPPGATEPTAGGDPPAADVPPDAVVRPPAVTAITTATAATTAPAAANTILFTPSPATSRVTVSHRRAATPTAPA